MAFGFSAETPPNPLDENASDVVNTNYIIFFTLLLLALVIGIWFYFSYFSPSTASYCADSAASENAANPPSTGGETGAPVSPPQSHTPGAGPSAVTAPAQQYAPTTRPPHQTGQNGQYAQPYVQPRTIPFQAIQNQSVPLNPGAGAGGSGSAERANTKTIPPLIEKMNRQRKNFKSD
jgi:hypothetical protein